MTTPTPDDELDAAAGQLHQDMLTLAELRQLVDNYRGTERDYRLLAEAEELKLPEVRARIRAKLAELRASA